MKRINPLALYFVGKSAKEVFRKTLPKLINVLGKNPPFSVVTASLNAEDLITDQELEAIRTKQGVERGSEVAYTLRDKIKESDDPNVCLLKICEIFESEDVDNAVLKKHGANMRTSISSKTHSISIYILSNKYFILIDGTAATPPQVPAVTPSAPPHSSAAALPVQRTNPNELSTIKHILYGVHIFIHYHFRYSSFNDSARSFN